MRLSETSIRRPVLATVMSLLLILLGLVSFKQLSVREYPRIDEPLVNVSTRLLGASSEVIESQISKPLEDSIAGIEGVDVLTSISRPEQSQITVRFRLDREPDGAAADVRDRVARVRARLPQEVDEPVIAKVEAASARWNIGPAWMYTVSYRYPTAGMIIAAFDSRLRCVSITPFDRPVVPPV